MELWCKHFENICISTYNVYFIIIIIILDTPTSFYNYKKPWGI